MKMPTSNEIGQIKQINTELNGLNSTLQKSSEFYLKLVKNVEDGNARIKEAGISFDKLKTAQKDTQKTSEDLDKVGKQLAATEEKLKQFEDQRIQTIIKNKQEISAKNKLTKDEIILNDKNSGTLEKLAAKNRILEAEKKKLNITTEAGQKRLKEINIEQDKNNKIIQESSNKLQKQKINIGNYQSALEGAGGALGGFARGLKALLANPVILIVAGIVGVFTQLKAAFESSERGRGVLAKGLGLLKGIGQVIFNLFSGLAEILIDAFENPKQAVIDLWDTIKNNIVNRFTGLIDLFNAVGNGLKALWNRDLKGLKNAAKEAGTAIVQMGTGLDKLQQSNAVEKITDQFKESRDLIKESVDLEVRQLRLREAQIAFITREAELNASIAKNRVDATDQLLSAEDRLRAASAYEQNINDLIESQKKLKKEELDIITLRNSLGKNTLEDTEKEKQLQADLIRLDEQRASEQRAINRARGRALDQLADQKVNEALNQQSEIQNKLQEQFVKGQLTYQEFQNKSAEATNASYQLQIDAINKVLNEEELTESKRVSLTKQRISIQNKLVQKQASEKIAAAKAEADFVENEAKRQYEFEYALVDASIKNEEARAEKLFEIKKQELEREKEILEERLKNEQLSSEERLNLMNEISDYESEIKTNSLNEDIRIEQARRQAKLDTLDVIKGIFGEQTKIGKIATAIQKADAIQQNLISLGVIGAKQAEAESKSAAAAPFPFNLPLIIGTIAQFIGIIALFKKNDSKIKALYTGSDSAPDKFVAGDRGRELMHLSSGELIMVDKPTYFEGSKFKGAKVYSNAETEKIINMSDRSMNVNVGSDSKLLDEVRGLRNDSKSRKGIKVLRKNGKITGFEKITA